LWVSPGKKTQTVESETVEIDLNGDLLFLVTHGPGVLRTAPGVHEKKGTVLRSKDGGSVWGNVGGGLKEK